MRSRVVEGQKQPYTILALCAIAKLPRTATQQGAVEEAASNRWQAQWLSRLDKALCRVPSPAHFSMGLRRRVSVAQK